MLSLLQGRLHKHNTGCFSTSAAGLPPTPLLTSDIFNSKTSMDQCAFDSCLTHLNQPLWNDTLLSRTWFSPWLKRLRSILLKVHHNCTCGLSRDMCPLSQDGSCWLNSEQSVWQICIDTFLTIMKRWQHKFFLYFNVFGCLDAGCLDVFRSVKNATQDWIFYKIGPIFYKNGNKL